MHLSKRNSIIAIVIFGLVVFSVLYALPYIAIFNIIKAFKEQDRERILELVDFPALRASVKSQLKETVMNYRGTEMNPELLEKLREIVNSQLLDKMVDQLVTPEGMILYTKGQFKITEAETGDLFWSFLKQARCSYVSPSEFIISIKEGDRDTLRFTLERHGYSWRWTKIRIIHM
ncbi:MAG: DUF2939 domain-containing protein [Syntrophales bacterium]|nr:DUF2939 domain-containing protein [Syntrophales bacterium]